MIFFKIATFRAAEFKKRNSFTENRVSLSTRIYNFKRKSRVCEDPDEQKNQWHYLRNEGIVLLKQSEGANGQLHLKQKEKKR